jgi:hypothetical protein
MTNLTPVGPYYNGVGFSSSGNSFSVCYSVTDVPSNPACFTNCGGWTVTLGDPSAASVGRTVSLSGGSTLTGATNVAATGAEAGTLGGCNGTGTCLTDTVVYANGTPVVNLANYTGVDVSSVGVPTRTQGTQIGCVSSVCVNGQKVSAGSVKVYVNSTSPTVTVPLCVSVGPGVTCP